MSNDKKLNVFVSYSHDDEPKWLERIQKHLTPLARGGKLDLWADTRIKSGQRWRDEIKGALARAEVAVLLISVNFYASDFIAKNELPPLLEAAESKRGLVILGVHINYSDFENDPRLSRYQTVNKPSRPIKALRSTADQDRVFLDLVRRIREVVPAQSAAFEIPREYLAWLKQRYGTAELLGQDIQQGYSFTLSSVYVPALTWTDVKRWDRNKIVAGQNWLDELRIPLLARINKNSLYVPAAAGAGKSTFCRWAALQSIPGAAKSHPIPAPKRFREPVPKVLRTRLPLLIPLRDFGKEMDCGRGRPWHRSDLEQALIVWVDQSALPGLDGAMLKAHLAAGTAFMLLDGLDEVPVSESRNAAIVYPRQLLLSGLADALPVWEKAGNRTLLTSRPYGLDEAGLGRLGVPRAPLDPLPEPLQELFVIRWFHTLKREELGGELLEAMRGRDDLAPLSENPMLLTAMCVLYDKGRRLPEDRYELYKSIVDNVLHARYPGDAREREPVLRRLEAIAHGMHTGEPDEAPRQTPAAEISWNETERLLAHFAEKNPSLGQGEVAAAVQREELLTRSGLLLPRPNERAAFYHLSFQEFLAAQRIARASEKRVTEAIDARVEISEWRQTLLFLFAAQLFSKDPEWGLDQLGRLLESQDRTAVKANPAPAVFIAEALELCPAKRYQIPEALAESFRRLTLDTIKDEIDVQARRTLGLCLGRLGDPRIPDLRDLRGYVEVPAGTYAFGKKGTTVEIAMPFRIGRYPVTNSQYLAFLEDDGYGDRKWWSDAGWDWLQKAGVTEPRYWRDRGWNGPNQPVVGVSFWEAEACCAWPGGRLPREQEWEAAARGPNGYEYPWGKDWKDRICNTNEAGLGRSSPVGLFPNSRQAQLGIEDLAGNVWEWCWPVAGDRVRSLRGGSWDSGQIDARCASGSANGPDFRSFLVGFRLVCSSPVKGH